MTKDLPGFAALTISVVERDTGLSKDTLRVWERRCGFAQPDRDGTGERLYPPPSAAVRHRSMALSS